MGEFFFSAPINNFNIWQDYSRSDDDQRHRLAFEGAVHSSYAQAHNIWQHLGHGMELSTSLTLYSPLPFNITTGGATVQGTSARPTVNGLFIDRNAGESFSTITLNVRLSRSFTLTDRLRLQALGEMFNTLNHVNVVTLNGVFGTGPYPGSPAPGFRQITAVNEPRSAQIALRLNF